MRVDYDRFNLAFFAEQHGIEPWMSCSPALYAYLTGPSKPRWRSSPTRWECSRTPAAPSRRRCRISVHGTYIGNDIILVQFGGRPRRGTQPEAPMADLRQHGQSGRGAVGRGLVRDGGRVHQRLHLGHGGSVARRRFDRRWKAAGQARWRGPLHVSPRRKASRSSRRSNRPSAQPDPGARAVQQALRHEDAAPRVRSSSPNTGSSRGSFGTWPLDYPTWTT